MKQLLNEGLDYLDLENQLLPKVSIDEYASTIGEDSGFITLAFTVKCETAGEDLVTWLERGYDFILDAQVSDGEISSGKYLVFAEMARRSTAPSRIIEILSDLETLTGLKVSDWTVQIDDEDYDASEAIIKQKVALSPKEYRVDEEQEEELNEMRTVAGLPTVKIFAEQDEEIKRFKNIAGL